MYMNLVTSCMSSIVATTAATNVATCSSLHTHVKELLALNKRLPVRNIVYKLSGFNYFECIVSDTDGKTEKLPVSQSSYSLCLR